MLQKNLRRLNFDNIIIKFVSIQKTKHNKKHSSSCTLLVNAFWVCPCRIIQMPFCGGVCVVCVWCVVCGVWCINRLSFQNFLTPILDPRLVILGFLTRFFFGRIILYLRFHSPKDPVHDVLLSFSFFLIWKKSNRKRF